MSMILQLIRERVNALFEGQEAYQVVQKTVATAVILYYSSKAARVIQRDGLKKTLFKLLMSVAKNVPGAAGKIEEEKKKALEKLEKSLASPETKNAPKYLALPPTGTPTRTLLEMLRGWKETEEKHWKRGQVSGGIYHGGDDFLRFLVEVYGYFALSNPLHSDIFPYIRKMESEVISMTLGMFNGGPGGCGVMTSGGTESICMAMLAYRNQARARGIKRPQLIVPVTAHAAFDKAAHYFDFEIVHVPVDQKSFSVDAKLIEKKITKNTMAIVGSAPAFPQGVIDPIAELSEIALKYKVGLHVDCCLGGFLLPFVAKLGYKVPVFDFQLPGVTTISADTHKYGYAPKGSSVLMFSNKELRHHQYFVQAEWPGGIYASPTLPGSRAGGLIAATWAAMVAMGESGYLECARAIMKAAKTIAAGIKNIDGLRVLGEPDMSVIAFSTDDSATGQKLNIYKISDAMKKRDWNLNTLQKPGSIHICCTYMHRDVADKFVNDLKNSVAEILQNPSMYKDGAAAIYGLAESLPDSSMTVEMAHGYLDAVLKAS